MPVIDVTFTAGTLNHEAQAAVAAQLTDTLMEIEGTKGIAAIAAGTWLILHEAPANTMAAGGKLNNGLFHVSIVTPVGTLSMAQKDELIRRVTDTMLHLAGVEVTPATKARVYCLVNEVPDGGWGFAGIAITKEYAEKRRKELEQGKA